MNTQQLLQRVGTIILTLCLWLMLAFVIQMVAIFIGFVVEDAELPLISAAIGFVIGITVFIVGFSVHTYRILTKNRTAPEQVSTVLGQTPGDKQETQSSGNTP